MLEHHQCKSHSLSNLFHVRKANFAGSKALKKHAWLQASKQHKQKMLTNQLW